MAYHSLPMKDQTSIQLAWIHRRTQSEENHKTLKYELENTRTRQEFIYEVSATFGRPILFFPYDLYLHSPLIHDGGAPPGTPNDFF